LLNPHRLPTPKGNSHRYGEELPPPVVQAFLDKQVLLSTQSLDLLHHPCGIVDDILPLKVVRLAH
jgi:hypothetical protein